MRQVGFLLLGYHPKSSESWSRTKREEYSFTTVKLPWKQSDKNIIYATNENVGPLQGIHKPVCLWYQADRKEVINIRLEDDLGFGRKIMQSQEVIFLFLYGKWHGWRVSSLLGGWGGLQPVWVLPGWTCVWRPRRLGQSCASPSCSSRNSTAPVNIWGKWCYVH